MLWWSQLENLKHYYIFYEKKHNPGNYQAHLSLLSLKLFFERPQIFEISKITILERSGTPVDQMFNKNLKPNKSKLLHGEKKTYY